MEELHGLGMLLSQQSAGFSPPPSGLPPSEMSCTLASDLGSKILESKGLSSGALTQSTCTPTSVLEDLDDMLEMDKSVLLLDTIQEQESQADFNSEHEVDSEQETSMQ